MLAPYQDPKQIQLFIQAALAEDIGSGDHSSLGAISPTAESRAHLLVKDDGLLAGVELAQHIFSVVDSELKLELAMTDGTLVKSGDIAFRVHGSARSILAAERLVLNCMQRMSGIATYTRALVDRVRGSGARLLDTRKTTPNFRLPEKWAVKIGGGVNHRFGLYDMVMLKDNHIDFAGGVRAAIEKTRAYLDDRGLALLIEVEVRSIDELKEVLAVGKVSRILLDNMLPSTLKQAVDLIEGRYETEASGGINESNIEEISETGVDYLSVGALTHSYKSLDMSLKAF